MSNDHISETVSAGLRRRFRVIDCQGERPPNVLLASQLEGSARALGIDFSIRAKAKREQALKDAWEDFRDACKRVANAAPDGHDPREQMFLFIRDMKP